MKKNLLIQWETEEENQLNQLMKKLPNSDKKFEKENQ